MTDEIPIENATVAKLELPREGQFHLLLQGDVRKALASLPAESVDCVVTSPPYWGLRDYKIEPSVWDGQKGCDHEWGTAQRIRESWGDTGILDDQKQGSNRGAKDNVAALTKPSNFCERCGAWKGQLGLEPDFRLYVRHIVEIMQGVKRVLKPTGSLYLNLGDTYSGGGSDSTYPREKQTQAVSMPETSIRVHVGIPPKSLIGIPERVMIAMQDDGWVLRNKPIWRKNNAMPTSVKDRYANTWEAVYFFVKSNEKAYWHNDKTLQVVGKQPLGTHGEEGKDWDWGWRQIDPRRQAKKVAKLLKESPDLLFEREYEDEDPLTGELRRYKELFAWGKVSHWRGHDYYFDLDAIRVPHKVETWGLNKDGSYRGKATKEYAGTGAQDPSEIKARMSARINPLGGKPGDVIGSQKWGSDEFQGSNKNSQGAQSFARKKHSGYFGEDGSLLVNPNGRNPGDVLEGPKQDAVIDPQTGEPKQTYVGFNERWKNKQRQREWTSEEALGREMGSPDPHRAALIGGLASGNAENHPGGKNPGDFWVVNTKGYPEAHFATFPLALVTNPIKASSPAEVCTACGLPRVRVVKTDYQVRVDHPKGEEPKLSQNEDNKFKTMPFTGSAIHTTTGWASCSCGAPFRPGVVLDPFGGSGTVSLGAKEQGRSSVYIDIKPEYLKMAKDRVGFGVPTLDGSVTWLEESVP